MFEPSFIIVTVFVMGFAGYMTGRAMANTWRPFYQLIVYCLLFGFIDRFLVFALFDGELLSMSGYIVDTILLIAISALSFRFNLSRKMVSQYPWLFERTGLFSWREITDNNSGGA